jgi:hypothetical protein
MVALGLDRSGGSGGTRVDLETERQGTAVLSLAWNGDDDQHPPLDPETPECREIWTMLHEVARTAMQVAA